MFEVTLAAFTVLAAMTLLIEYRRVGGMTPLSMLTVSNGMYCVLTPTIAYYSPASAPIFNGYVEDAGISVTDAGLGRMLAAAAIFQLMCWFAALGDARSVNRRGVLASSSDEYLLAAVTTGWVFVSVGIVGALYLGLSYNQNFFGLYQITYADRSPFFRDHGVFAFLLLLGVYGASQLIATYLLMGRVGRAALILLFVILHGIGIKSKFPIFWTLLVFVSAAVGGRRVDLRKLLIPLAAGALVLFSMSAFRGVENAEGLSDYIETSQKEGAHFWENDVPGPASITYFLVNDDGLERTLAPLLEVPKLLVPKFLYDRGDVLPEIWAAKMLGPGYEVGMGFGWSLLCDGYLMGGLLGVAFFAYLISRLARLIGIAAYSCDGRDRAFRFMVMYTCMPIFFLGFRESFAGLIKALIIISIVIWAPTILLVILRRPPIIHGESVR